jgi:hypothetical protein
MKKSAFIMILLGVTVAALASHITGNLNSPSFNWKSLSHDFGQIKQGVPVTHEFTFVNNGTEALIISSVKASCGCTVADYSKDPIPSGESGYVKATYNAASAGAFNKTVTVMANTDGENVLLTIRGTVVAE